jgi:transcriptional regulator with XRE-family HTH domain
MRATKLKLLRLELNRLQVEVALAAGINQARLSLLENGHVAPRGDELDRLSRALGVPVELLRAAQTGATA